MLNTRKYAKGTSVTHLHPWGTFVSAEVLCPDGKVRKVKRISTTADTFFSVPCSVEYNGKTIAGYMTLKTVSGGSVETEDDPAVVCFRPYLNRKNGAAFPLVNIRDTVVDVEVAG